MSEEELYNNIVEILSKGDFLQINGKPINLKELNDYINSQQQEIERLNNIINDFEEELEREVNTKEEEIHKKEAMYDNLAVDYRLAQEEIERLNNIIKEVREYIEKNTKEGPIKDKRYFYSPEQANDILEILDKGE